MPSESGPTRRRRARHGSNLRRGSGNRAEGGNYWLTAKGYSLLMGLPYPLPVRDEKADTTRAGAA